MTTPVASRVRSLGCALSLLVCAAAAGDAAAGARLCTSADTLLFGDRPVGSSTTRRAVVSSCGDAPLRLTEVAVHPATGSAFHVSTDCASGVSLPAGATCSVDVTFTPATAGQTSGALWLHNDSVTPDQLVTFYARGVDAAAGTAALSFEPAMLDFGAVPQGERAGPRTLTLRNVGGAPLVPSALVLNGPAAFDFSTPGDGRASMCGVGVAIAPGSACDIVFWFAPRATGTRRAQLNVDAPQLAGLAVASIAGRGTEAHAAPSVDVVEFAHPPSGQYFLATDPAEIAMLDAGGPGGAWQRTGMGFRAWPADAAEPADAQPVCRFFGTPGSGPDSHFFTASPGECAAVRGDAHWIAEGIAFRAALPVAGQCGAGRRAVLRLWRAGTGPTASRHRYVVDATLVAPLVAGGWVLEGAVLCVPQGQDALPSGA